jgi:hypothetical protein
MRLGFWFWCVVALVSFCAVLITRLCWSCFNEGSREIQIHEHVPHYIGCCLVGCLYF